MNLKSRKILGFFIGISIITSIYFVTLFFNPELLKTIGITLITMIPALVGVFVGGNSIDKYIISKHYNENLDKK